jgi:hypothetical protein
VLVKSSAFSYNSIITILVPLNLKLNVYKKDDLLSEKLSKYLNECIARSM